MLRDTEVDVDGDELRDTEVDDAGVADDELRVVDAEERDALEDDTLVEREAEDVVLRLCPIT